jgi:hypothetical protein
MTITTQTAMATLFTLRRIHRVVFLPVQLPNVRTEPTALASIGKELARIMEESPNGSSETTIVSVSFVDLRDKLMSNE